jgi:uncharacterized protein (DUF736 family)
MPEEDNVTTDQLDEFGRPINDPNAPVQEGDDPMLWDSLEKTLPGSENEPLPDVAPSTADYDTSIPATGSQFDLGALDRIQTADEFNRLTDAQKELFYLRHNEGVAMTPKDAANYILKRNEQKQAQKAPLYQIKMRTEEANAIKAEREGRGEEYFANGWERYQDPETKQIRMRIIPGSPAEKAIVNSSQIKSRNAQTVIDALNQAEAVVDSFGATGFVGQMTQGIDALPAGVLRQKLETARGVIAVDRLLEMKASGGTMGALNQSELELLKNIQGALRVGLPADVLKPQIQSVRAMWENVLSKMSEQDMQALDAPAQAAKTGETKKILGQTRYKYSDGSWRSQ